VEYLEEGGIRTTNVSYDSTVLATIFIYTNAFRAAAGKPPLYPPLRGRYTTLSDAIIRESQTAQTLSHYASYFTQGYEYFWDRTSRCGADGDLGAGENVEIGEFRVYPGETLKQAHIRIGIDYTYGWALSPPHYANMVNDWVNPSQPYNSAAFMELSLGSGTARAVQEPPYTEDPVTLVTPIQGMFSAQVFRSRDKWVDFGDAVWQGTLGTVSWDQPSNPVEPCILTTGVSLGGASLSRQNLYIKGHGINMVPRPDAEKSANASGMYVIGGGMFSHGYVYSAQETEYRNTLSEPDKIDFDSLFGDVVYAAAVVFVEPNGDSPPRLDLTISSFGKNPVVAASYTLPAKYGEVLRAVFSPSGISAVVRVAEIVPNSGPFILHNQRNFSLNSTLPNDKTAYGQDLLFIEFSIDLDTVANEVFASAALAHRSSVTVDVVKAKSTVVSTTRTNEYEHRCEALYRCWAAYDTENQLVFATNQVESHTIQSCEFDAALSDTIPVGTLFSLPEATGSVVTKSKGTLAFPDGTSFVHTDTSGSFKNATGYSVQFNNLDITRPSEMIYTRMDMVTRTNPPPPAPPSTRPDKRKLNIKVYDGTDIVFAYEDCGQEFNDQSPATCRVGADIGFLTPAYFFVMVGTYVPHWRTVWPRGWITNGVPNVNRPEGDAVYKVDYKADLSTPAFTSSASALSDETGFSLSRSISPYVGNYFASTTAQRLRYDGQMLTAIGLRPSVDWEDLWVPETTDFATLSRKHNAFGPPLSGWPRVAEPQTPDTVKVVHVVSSIDLQGVTGVGDLDDNIFPIGVL
jgi:hypothetical protein